jgi:hypothetical protein
MVLNFVSHEDAMDNLADALVDNLLQMSDEEIIAEAGGSEEVEKAAADFDRIVNEAIGCVSRPIRSAPAFARYAACLIGGMIGVLLSLQIGTTLFPGQVAARRNVSDPSLYIYRPLQTSPAMHLAPQEQRQEMRFTLAAHKPPSSSYGGLQ